MSSYMERLAALRRQTKTVFPPRLLRWGESTVLIPAYNEEKDIATTILALFWQGVAPENIIVIDDCSTDETGEIAKALGVRVVRTTANVGNKAAALNFGLLFVETEFTLSVDADTIVGRKTIPEMIKCLQDDPNASHVSCAVIPQKLTTLWEWGRNVEYIFSLAIVKKAQDRMRMITVASGCCVMFRTEILLALGGYSLESRAEDMLLTWDHLLEGYHSRYLDNVFCYPRDPDCFKIYVKQIERWIQETIYNMKLRRMDILFVRPSFGALLIHQAVSPFLGVVGSLETLWYMDMNLTYAFLGFVVLLCSQAFVITTVCHVQSYHYDKCGVDPAKTSFWKILIGTLFLLIVMANIAKWIYLRAIWRVFVRGSKLTHWNKGH